MRASDTIDGEVIDAMVELTRAMPSHRIILAGRDRKTLCIALHRRGLIRAASTDTVRFRKHRYVTALLAGQDSVAAMDANFRELQPFLSGVASLAMLLDARLSYAGVQTRTAIEQRGFRIEAGVRCRQGLVLSAVRPTMFIEAMAA